jgi:SAM-dependent methyltransferase
VPAPSLGARLRTSVALRARDVADRLTGRADRLTPPRRLDTVGDSDFIATGEEFLGHLVRLCGLRPDHAVLDVGCGIGRMARPLARHLSPAGSYDGFDVDRAAIDWCRRRYRRLGNFRFLHADLRNGRYNAAGTGSAAAYRFPYADARFDVVLAASVFTHLVQDEAERYLAEIARVLRPGGRALVTFFLLDDAARAAIRAGRARFAFREADGPMAVVDERLPEEAVAYDERWVRARLQGCGLTIAGIHHGSWSGRDAHTSFQDIVVAHH